MIVNINGQFVDATAAHVPISDGGFLYGDTLFETLSVENGRIHFLNEHLARLKRSAHWSHFPFPGRAIAQALEAVRRKSGNTASTLRLTLSRGDYAGPIRPAAEQVRFVITARERISEFSAERHQGVACIAAPNQRVNALAPLPQMKRGNYQDCLHALHHARAQGAFEALFVTPDGHLLEGATSNLFVVRNGVLITPPLGELVLAGIMRAQVLRAADALRLPWRETAVTLGELQAAQEAFITNSLIELLPISSWEGQPVARGTLYSTIARQIATYN